MNARATSEVDAGMGGWAALGGLLLVATLLVAFSSQSCSPKPDSKKRPLVQQKDDSGKRDESPKTDVARHVATGPTKTGRELYLQHCAACHGEQGDGQGVASRFLFPKPRDFRAGKFRLVSTTNGVPTPEDLDAVLVRGMPGSSMPLWSHLSQRDRQALVDEVLRLFHDGSKEQYVKLLKENDGLTDEEIQQPDVQKEIEEFAQRRTTPGAASDVPAIPAPDDAAIARGKDIYFKQSCHSCHGNEGKGDGQQKMADDEGFPTRPRDLTLGIFKGGHDPASLYRRIAYGMPGTPMPSSSQLNPQQQIDLVHFIRSMSDEETRQRAIMNRERIVAKRVASLPMSGADNEWSAAQSVSVNMVPLWWRDNADPGLRVQAMHDGNSIAMRLTWKDGSEDGDAARSESFEDAIAVELYRGPSEPFIGMGDPNSPVDVWYWDADRQGTPLAVETLYPNAVVDIYPFSETVVATAESDRPGARTADQPDISLPAKASGNPIVPSDDKSGSSSLTVGGLGSVTFRVPQSQLVKAHGEWRDGRWTVVMTRTLAVASADNGVALESGGTASAAFAIWDGSQKDRDGKKLISVWQDFVLEGTDGSIPDAPPSLVKKPTPITPTPKPTPKPKDQTAKTTDPPPKVTPKPTPVADGAWGNLRGRFVYDGLPPTPKAATVNKDVEVCGKHNLIKESLLVNKENRGLANVIVYLYARRGTKLPPVHPSYAQTANAEVSLDNAKCRFEPHVTLLRTSQKLHIRNIDPVGHNTKIDAQVNSPINPNTPAGGSLKHQFSSEERAPVMVSCSVHGWMTSWILVRELPYFAKTDADGNFEIKNLPAGEWSFRLWHERPTYISQVNRGGKDERLRAGQLTLTIKPGDNDLGEIKVSPTLFE